MAELTILEERGFWSWPIFSMADKVKFRRFVRPGDLVRLETELLSVAPESAQCKVRALVEGRVVAQAEQTFVFDPEGLGEEEDRRLLAEYERKQFKILWDGWPAYAARVEGGA